MHSISERPTQLIMRVLFAALICLSFVSTSFAQSTSTATEHLTFKGIPIDGELNEYVASMQSSGFTLIGKEDGIALLQGDFAAHKDCTIGVATLADQDLVSRIIVMFPECDTWAELSSVYSNLKELLTIKYGKPSEVIETFNTRYQPDDDHSKMHEVGMNNCSYYVTYEVDNGTIQLSIENDGFISSFVMLTYFDAINSDKVRQKAIDDL